MLRSSVLKRARETVCAITCVIVRTSETGCSGSMSAITRRTAGAISAGSPSVRTTTVMKS